jgi:hypothetical protein
MDDSWTIAELADLAAEALAPGLNGAPDSGPEGESQRANGRVRDVPNERLIRWYGTVGLVDPPLSRRGRVARYGRRHLLQLVAVKRRQAEGKSLAEIQEELAGATDAALAAVARVPALGPLARGGGPEPTASAGPPVSAGPPASAQPARFWARQPGRPVAEEPVAGPGSGVTGVPPAGFVHGIRLAPGVLLLLDGAGPDPGPDDLAAILNAARPLLRELASRNLGGDGSHHRAEMDPQDGSPK